MQALQFQLCADSPGSFAALQLCCRSMGDWVGAKLKFCKTETVAGASREAGNGVFISRLVRSQAGEHYGVIASSLTNPGVLRKTSGRPGPTISLPSSSSFASL